MRPSNARAIMPREEGCQRRPDDVLGIRGGNASLVTCSVGCKPQPEPVAQRFQRAHDEGGVEAITALPVQVAAQRLGPRRAGEGER